jgi:hypothetical protein
VLHAEYLMVLERARSLGASLVADELRGHADAFLVRRWIINDGYQTSILVPVLDSEVEVEVDIDDDNNTFSFRSPGLKSRILTRPLSEITLYVINMDAWMDEISDLLGIEPSRRARKREVIKEHLWHLGDIRYGGTHQFAPIYVARRLDASAQDWNKALLDAKRPSQGIVLTAFDIDIDLPNSHQACCIDRLVINTADGLVCDVELLNRLLKGMAAGADDPNEYFDQKSGELKLACIVEPKIFSGKQRAVIEMLWKARSQHGVKWADLVMRTGCGKDPDSVFGIEWERWLERISGQRGYYRLRTRRS